MVDIEDTGGARERRLTSGDFSVLSFDWSADARFIAFAHAPSPEDSDVTFRSDVSLMDCDSLKITPVAQGMALYNALKSRDMPVEMVLYPRSCHVVSEPRLVADVLSRNLSWFEEHIPAGGR